MNVPESRIFPWLREARIANLTARVRVIKESMSAADLEYLRRAIKNPTEEELTACERLVLGLEDVHLEYVQRKHRKERR